MASNNPYYIQPANGLQALMIGVDAFKDTYGAARKQAGEDELKAGRQSAMQRLMAGADPREVIAPLIGAGDVKGAEAAAQFAHHRATEAQAKASQEQSRAQFAQSHGLAREQFTAGQEGQKVPPGFERNPAGPAGGLTPVPGGPADPEYIQSTTAAKAKPVDNLEPEGKLRKEFEGNAKTHLDVRRGYERVLSSKDDAAGDISLIFGYMKMLDPGSVVREGEFATAQNAAGIPDRVQNVYNRALSGERLTNNQRNMFKGQGKALYDTSAREYGAREKQFREIATKYKLDPDRIIPNLGPEPGQNAPSIPPPPAGFNLVR